MSEALVDEKPLVEFTELMNPDFTLLVYIYLLGQFRIQLTDTRLPDEGTPAGHGAIVQEMCTCDGKRLADVITLLRLAEDPLLEARAFARPWNCEGAGGRIRLDNKPPDDPSGTYVCGCAWSGQVVPHYCPSHHQPIVFEIRGRGGVL